MNSIEDLNTSSATAFEFTDNRTAGFRFDRTLPTNRSLTVNEGSSHTVPLGIDILEIINYSTLNAAMRVDLSSAPSGTTIDFGTLPTGCVLTESPSNVYTVTNINTVDAWNSLKAPEIDLGSVFNGTFSYTVSILSSTLSPVEYTVSMTVLEVFSLTTPTAATYTRGSTQLINAPDLQDTGGLGINWTITVDSSDYPEALDTISTTSSAGGTLTWTSGTKTAEIYGNIDQVNDILNTLSITFASDSDLTFTLRYESENDTNSETDIVVQVFTSTSTDILGSVRSTPNYLEDQANDISGGPLITSGETGRFVMDISANPNGIVESMDILGNFIPTYTQSTFFEFAAATTSNHWQSANDYYFNQTLSADLDADRIVAGVQTADSGNGAVYILKRASDGTYAIETTITKSSEQYVGEYVHINSAGDQVTFGCQTALFTYTRSGTTWTQQDTISGSDFVARDVSYDGQVLVFEDGGDLKVYTWVSNAWSLRQTVYTGAASTPETNYVRHISVNNDGTVFTTSGAGKEDSLGNTVGGFDIYRWNGSTSYTREYNVELGVKPTGTLPTYYGAPVGVINQAGDAFITVLEAVGLTTTSIFKYYKYSGSWTEKTGFTRELGNNDRDWNLSPDGLVFVTSPDNGGQVRYDIETNTWSSLAANSARLDNTGYTPVAFSKNNQRVAVADRQDQNIGIAKINVNDADQTISFDSSTDTLTITGIKTSINTLIDDITLTPTSGTQPDFDLVYSVTTPLNNVSKRNQNIVNGS